MAGHLLETGKSLPSNPHALALHGPREYSTLDLQEALEQVTGEKVAIKAYEPEQLLDLVMSTTS